MPPVALVVLFGLSPCFDLKTELRLHALFCLLPAALGHLLVRLEMLLLLMLETIRGTLLMLILLHVIARLHEMP